MDQNPQKNHKREHHAEDSSVLYGVPRAQYGAYQGCTPYPICLKACLNYLGEDLRYDEIMVRSAAAFRLTWNTGEWDGGNVDICFAYDDPGRSYTTGVEAMGRECTLLWRTEETPKDAFTALLRAQLDRGNPVIALGVIGPPEAGIVTGYRDGGETLLGWNVFQDNPEFGGDVKLDESGYYVCDTWWENPCTLALIAIGERVREPWTLKQVLEQGIEVLTGRQSGPFAKGVAAYDAWAKVIGDDAQFPAGAVLPLLVERLMCQGDATDCLQDGRGNAASYLRGLAEGHPHGEALREIASHFQQVANQAQAMSDSLGGWMRGEAQMRALAQPETRRAIVQRIEAAKAADTKALGAMRALCALL